MNTRQRSVIRRACLVQAALLLVWAWSHAWTCRYTTLWFGPRAISVAIGNGAVCGARFDHDPRLTLGWELVRTPSPRWDWKPEITSDIWPTGTRASAPFWLIMATLLAAQVRAFRRHRTKAGECAACGYPLGDPQRAVCPECGSRPNP